MQIPGLVSLRPVRVFYVCYYCVSKLTYIILRTIYVIDMSMTFVPPTKYKNGGCANWHTPRFIASILFRNAISMTAYLLLTIHPDG